MRVMVMTLMSSSWPKSSAAFAISAAEAPIPASSSTASKPKRCPSALVASASPSEVRTRRSLGSNCEAQNGKFSAFKETERHGAFDYNRLAVQVWRQVAGDEAVSKKAASRKAIKVRPSRAGQ